jgi:V8-like Glu-specific endopeptidase
MRMILNSVVAIGLLGFAGIAPIAAQSSSDAAHSTVQGGAVTVVANSTAGGATIDYIHAKPMKLPTAPGRSEAAATEDLINALRSTQPSGRPGFSAGSYGDGALDPTFLGAPARQDTSDEVTPEEFGTNNHAFSTARGDLNVATNTRFPYRVSGRLFFNIGGDTFVCSASLIKKGVVVTAAHCVANFGTGQLYSNWHFIPGYRNGAAPFGDWTVKNAFVLTSYLNGSDPCAVAGVVCRDDVAVLLLNAKAGKYPGTSTGWYGFGWNGLGFTSAGLTHITQVGYPVCLDNGELMERNDSQGFKSAANSNNTVIGSLMCGGSSGGPWLINFGVRPSLTGTTAGTAPDANVVVGVTSWGFVSNAPKEQGASPFLSGNIVPLVNSACSAVPAACT